MMIRIPRDHKYKDMVGPHPVAVVEPDCPTYKCFRPHNYMYTRTDGKIIADVRCMTRERMGCPDYPEDLKE